MATKTFTGKPPKISFASAFEKTRHYFDTLVNCTARHRLNLADIPRQGIYVFFEKGKALYVGRTDNLKRRIQEHGRQGSGHNDASFAYHLAKEEATKLNIDTNRTRVALRDDADFKKCYLESKQRVANMQVKYVEISDPYGQVLFEVFAALELKARYTNFANS